MINKNDCFDCANCTKEDLLNPNSKWICSVTKEEVPKDLEGDCIMFKYDE